MWKSYLNRIEKKTVRQRLLGILFLLCFLQSVMLSQIQTDSGTIPVSVVYIFSLVFLPYLLLNIRRWRLPPWYITGLFLFVLLYAVVAGFRWGYSRTILNWIYGAFLLVTVLTFGCDFLWEDWQRILNCVALLFAAAVAVNLIMNASVVHRTMEAAFAGDLREYLSSAVGYRSLTRGGRNLDATWLCMGAYFVNKKWKLPYWAFGLAFSLMFSSRVGIIASGIFLIWYLLIAKEIKLTKKTLILFGATAIAALAALFASGLLGVLIARFTGIESGKPILEAILSGRKPIWERVWPMFRDNPFGYGCGNAMSVMKSNYGFAGYEGNTHNVFAQFLLDEGVIGGVWFLGLVAVFLKKEGKTWFRHPLAAWFLTYLILSLVQFHGGEGQMQFVLGIYLCTNGYIGRKKSKSLLGQAENKRELPLISVIIPVYNVKAYVAACVDSVMRQTYQPLEVLLIDDGSTDGSGDICDSYALCDDRIRVVHQTNRGLSAARNAGMELARGAYLFFLDSDDYLAPQAIEILYSALSENDAQIAICMIQKTHGQTEGKDRPTVLPFGKPVVETGAAMLGRMLYQKDFDVSAGGKLVPAEIAGKYPFPEGKQYEDLATTYRWFREIGQAVFVPLGLYYYFQREGSITRSAFTPKMFDQVDAVDELRRHIERWTPALLPAADSRVFSCYCQVLFSMLTDGCQNDLMREKLRAAIMEDADKVRKDRNCRFKNRAVAAIVSLYGQKGLDALGRIKGRV